MYTLADLHNIQRAIATGHLSVEVDGEKVIFRNMKDLKIAERTIKNSLKKQKTSRFIPLTTSKNL